MSLTGKMCKKHALTFFFIFALCSTFLAYWWCYVIPEHNSIERCNANLYYLDKSKEDGFAFDGTIEMDYHGFNEGVYQLFGTVRYNGSEFTFSRRFSFSYIHLIYDKYDFIIQKEEILTHDNMPSALAARTINLLSLKGRHIYYIHGDGSNVITYSNSLSPVFNCLVQP